MENFEAPTHGCCSLNLPHVEFSVYTWDLRVPTKSKLVEGFQQPRAPLQVSEKIRFDTGVLAKAKHYWIMTLDIAKMGLTFVLPSEESESKYTVEELRLDFFEKSQRKIYFLPHVAFQHNILNQNEDFVESELHLTHPVWTENIDTIRITWTIKARIGRVSLMRLNEKRETIINEDLSAERVSCFEFSDLYLSDHLSDLTIQCQGVEIPAHRSILCGKSPVFSAMFLHEMRENEEKLLTIEDIRIDVLKEMLRYIYTGDVQNLDEICCDLLPVSEKYQLLGLKNLCEICLGEKVTVENAIEMHGLGDLYGANHLKQKCLKFLKLSKSDILQDRLKLREMNKRQPELIFDVLFDSIGDQ